MGEEGKKLTEPDQTVNTTGEVQGAPPEVSTDESKKYSEKTQEELVAMLKESEKTLQQKAAREKELQDTVTILQDVNKPKQQPSTELYGEAAQQVQPIVPEGGAELLDTDYLTVGETKKFIEQKLKADREVQQTAGRKRLITTAGIAHEKGKQSMRNNPELFKGIEKEVEKAILDTFNPILNQGYDVSTYVSDPETWDKTAKWIRFQREEYDYLKPSQRAGIIPVLPVLGQTPNQTKIVPLQAGPTVKIEGASRTLMNAFGLDEEEAKKSIQEGRRRARGED